MSKAEFVSNQAGMSAHWYAQYIRTSASEKSVVSPMELEEGMTVASLWESLDAANRVSLYDVYFRLQFRRMERSAKQAEFVTLYGLSMENEEMRRLAKKAYKRYYQKEYRYQGSTLRRVSGIKKRSVFLAEQGITSASTAEEKAAASAAYEQYYQAQYQQQYERKGKRHRLGLELSPAQYERLSAAALDYERHVVEDEKGEQSVRHLGRFVLSCAEAYLDGKRVYRHPDNLNKVMRQFKGIASNINHIARYVARRDMGLRESYDELKQEFNRLAATQAAYFTSNDDLLYSIEEAVAADADFLIEIEGVLARLKKSSGV